MRRAVALLCVLLFVSQAMAQEEKEVTGERAKEFVTAYFKGKPKEPAIVSFERLKADHASFTGQVVAMEADVKADDYWNFSFLQGQSDFYCLRLGNKPRRLWVYAPRPLWKKLIDEMVSAEEKGKTIRIVAAFMVVSDAGWDNSLLVDACVIGADGKRGDWMLRQTAIRSIEEEAKAKPAAPPHGTALPPTAYRTWNDTKGKFLMKAAFVSLKSGVVSLQKEEDDTVVKVPMTKLSVEGRKYAIARQKEQQSPRRKPTTKPTPPPSR